jgi:hypothetical protein
MSEDLIDKGSFGEQAFHLLMDQGNQPYIFIDQTVSSFSDNFRLRENEQRVKRPGFLVNVKSFGSLALDVKYQRLYEDPKSPYFTMNGTEYLKARAFSQMFGLHWWWVFKANNIDSKDWYWVNIKNLSATNFKN